MKTAAARAISVTCTPDGSVPHGFSRYMALRATNINILTLALFYMIIYITYVKERSRSCKMAELEPIKG